jgi:hypothetical protein
VGTIFITAFLSVVRCLGGVIIAVSTDRVRGYRSQQCAGAEFTARLNVRDLVMTARLNSLALQEDPDPPGQSPACSGAVHLLCEHADCENVVSPLGGPFSWYTDQVNDGSKQYQTYMTKELPPLINAEHRRIGVGGIAVDRLRALPVTCEIAVNLFGAAADSL